MGCAGGGVGCAGGATGTNDKCVCVSTVPKPIRRPLTSHIQERSCVGFVVVGAEETRALLTRAAARLAWCAGHRVGWWWSAWALAGRPSQCFLRGTGGARCDYLTLYIYIYWRWCWQIAARACSCWNSSKQRFYFFWENARARRASLYCLDDDDANRK